MNTKPKIFIFRVVLICSLVLNIGLAAWITLLYHDVDVIAFIATDKEKSNSEETAKNENKQKDDNNKNNAQEDAINETSRDEKIQKIINKMSLEDKIAQLFIVTPEALTYYEVVVAAGEYTQERFEQYPVGGLIYFSQNMESREQTQEMLSNVQQYSMQRIGLPVFTCVDEEGGSVARIASNPAFNVPTISSMAEIGSTGDASKAYEVGTTLGKYLSELGFNVDFAPVADVLSNSENTVVYDRSFGADCDLVAEMVVQQLKGMAKYAVTGTVKHFPGHGATSGDSHDGFTYTDKTLDEMLMNELVPFKKAIENDAKIVMIGHFSAPQVNGDNVPCSLSETMITEVLRDQMQYDGLVITDALNMGAIVQNYDSATTAMMALNAGVDLLLMPDNFEEAYNGVLENVKSGQLSEQRIDESLKRIIALKMEIGKL